MWARSTLAARQCAVLFAVAGLLAFAGLAERDADRLQFALIGVASLLTGALAIALPWTRWRRASEVFLFAPALGLIGAAEAVGLLPPRSYGALFILVFAWIGAHRRPGTSFRVLPFAAAAYIVPVVASARGIPFSPPGCIVTLAVCVLVAETIARAMRSRIVAEQATARAAETMRLILDSAPQPTIAVDRTGRITVANRAAAVALGNPDGDALMGIDLHDLMHHTNRDGTPYPTEDCPLSQALHEGAPAHLDDEMFFRQDGTAFFADCLLEPVRHGDDTVGAVVTFSDVTQRRREMLETWARLQDSERAAATDPLTGIGNRRHADAFMGSVATGDAVVLVDIDHFKRVNDERGHAAGDDVLRRLAQHLAAHIPGDDHVARFGGEEFLVVLAGASSTAVATMERISAAWSETGIGVTLSAGVAVHRAGQPVLETLAAADQALYAAKADGRDRVVAASPDAAVRA